MSSSVHPTPIRSLSPPRQTSLAASRFAPKQASQPIAEMGMSGHCKVAQQRLHLTGDEPRDGPVAYCNVESTKEAQPQSVSHRSDPSRSLYVE
ncbi:MAG: hypothetical protein KatS3mg057_2452 [Herpetosiphonaceae bacterium]|nr:MAG: hypothetical protein KatS3mg057_2452 [Herpetosiphonaceae bacterium]